MKLLKLTILALTFPAAAFADGDVNWNVSTNPLGLLIGPNVRLERKLNDHWTFGPDLRYIYFNAGGLKMNGYSVGLDAKYYFKNAFTEHTWWVGGGLSYGGLKVKYSESNGTESNADVRAGSLHGLGGYQWFWGNFNLALGAGLDIHYISSREIIDQNGNKKKDIPYVPVGLAADASIGWTF